MRAEKLLSSVAKIVFFIMHRLGCAAGGHTFINNRIYFLALARNMEMPNDHLFAPFWGADGDHVVYRSDFPAGLRGL